MPDPLLSSLSRRPSGWRGRVEDVADRLGVSVRAVMAAAAVAVVAASVVAAAALGRSQGAPAGRPDAHLPRAVAPSSTTVAGAGDKTAGSGTSSGSVSATGPSLPAPVVVDVGGAVTHPGVYRLTPGARVADAIAAAGGPTADADLARVNQAQVLADGAPVRLPRRGEPDPAVPVGSSPAGAGGSSTGPGSSVPAVVDLNRATVEQLDALPGVGPATAQAIVEWRTRHGRFTRVDQLLDVPGIGPAKLDHLRALVRV